MHLLNAIGFSLFLFIRTKDVVANNVPSSKYIIGALSGNISAGWENYLPNQTNVYDYVGIKTPASCSISEYLWIVNANAFMFESGLSNFQDLGISCPSVYFNESHNNFNPMDYYSGEILDLLRPDYQYWHSDRSQCWTRNFVGVNKLEIKNAEEMLTWFVLAVDRDSFTYYLAEVGEKNHLRLHLNRRNNRDCKKEKCWYSTISIETKMMEKFQFSSEHLLDEVLGKLYSIDKVIKAEIVLEERTASNIAILILPLIMSLPPISLIEPQNIKVTIWYVIATDYVAAIPLLIKSIELIYRGVKASANGFETRELKGETFSFFSTLQTTCIYTNGRFLGFILLALCLWSMVASSIAEFLFWRKSTNRHNEWIELEKSDFMDESGTIGDITPSNLGILNRLLWNGTRKCISLQLLIINIALGVMIIARIRLYNTVVMYVSLFVILTTTSVLHIYIVNSFKKLFWRYVIYGFLFGILAPVAKYALYFKREWRNYETFMSFMKGSNVALALLPTIVLLFFTSKIIYPILTLLSVYSLIYILADIIDLVLQSEQHDRVIWKFGIFGTLTSIAFGPFSFLFYSCFPESRSNRRVLRNFNFGVVYGILLIISFSFLFFEISAINIVSFLSNE